MALIIRSKHWVSKKFQGFGIILKTDSIPFLDVKRYLIFEFRLFYYSSWIIVEEKPKQKQ
jgi:hypothetical protein